jgi:hypothetical protein
MAGHPVPIDGWRTTSAPNHCLARAFLNELGTAGALDKKTSAGRAGARSRTRVYGARDRVAVAIDVIVVWLQAPVFEVPPPPSPIPNTVLSVSLIVFIPYSMVKSA